jgi:hypothetical protein
MVQYQLEVAFSGLQAVTTFPVAGKKYVVIDQENQTTTFDSDGHLLTRRWSTPCSSCAAVRTGPY